MNRAELDKLAQAERLRQSRYRHRVFCCTSTACLSAGAHRIHAIFQQAIGTNRSSNEYGVEVVQTGCMGLCSRGPLVRLETQAHDVALYGHVTPQIAQQLVNTLISAQASTDENAAAVHDHDFSPGTTPHFQHSPQQPTSEQRLEKHLISPDLPFFRKQVKIVLSESGRIDPTSLEDCLAHGGYQSLAHVLENMSPAAVCKEVLNSGLRGRGGAGFPTGKKWEFARQETATQKYVIINGDEGDPGAYMDRTIMEDDPHRVLEGMLICAYAIGASSGYFYIRGEYPTAIERIRRAIRAARRRGLLGKSVMGTPFSFEVDVRIGAGAFVCGEETALIHSVEGKRGTPRMRPPYPSASGLRGSPTVINNVETIANIPSIIKKGAAWFAKIGTEQSKGTKVFALAGQLTNTGLIEVPMGITLREIVADIGGGVPDNRAFKAVQTGGPSGGCIPTEFLDTPVTYESLKQLGSIMGSGGLVVIDDTTRMPDFARFFIDFCVDESCGKCLPCRLGTLQLRNLLDKLIAREGSASDLEKLEKLCKIVKIASLCGLGQSAPNPVLSTLKYFKHEYEALIPADTTAGTISD